MGQRNIISTHQMPDLKSEQGHIYLHPDYHSPPSNIANYPNQNTYPVMSTSGNAADLNLHQFTDHHGRNVIHGNQCNTIQYYHPVLGGAAPYFYNPYMLPSSSRNFSVLVNNGSADQFPSSDHVATGTIMDAYGRYSHFIDSDRGCKRKNAEVITGNFCDANGPVNSNLSSANISPSSGQLQWEEPYGANLALISSEYQVTGILPTTDGLHRSVRSISNHHNYLIQGNYMGQSFQPSPNGWVEQFENYYGDGGCSNWNYTGAMNYMHGRCLHSGPVGTVNMRVPEFQDASSNITSAFNLHPPSLSDHHCLPPLQSMQVHCYNQHPQIPATSYWHPVNYLQTNNVYPYANGTDSGSRLPRPVPSVAEQIYWSLPEAAQEISHGSLRIRPPEDAAAMAISQFYGFGGVGDQDGDMRMNIDDMSYEELLALEEQIGDVDTGLSEDFILKNLKTSARVPQPSSSLSDLSSQSENEACAVCLEEYEEKQRVGSVNCGHRYHADCIKRWLLIKNQCPICKTSALGTDRGE